MVRRYAGRACEGRSKKANLPLMRSTHCPTLILSLLFIILRASSSRTSPVILPSITSITRSERLNRFREESRVIEILLRNASSMRMHPRSVYEMLSFQKER